VTASGTVSPPSAMPAPRSWRSGLAVAAVAVVLALGLLELGMRLVAPGQLEYFNSDKFRRRSTRPGWTWELVPNASQASYIGAPVTINSLGLRDRELERPKPPRTVRIVGVGDSVTFGYGVRLDETFLKILERRLNDAAPNGTRYEVVNAGIEATGLDYYYGFVQSAAPAIEPDLVLVNLALNDIAEYAPPSPRVASQPSRLTPAGVIRRVNDFFLYNSQLYQSSYLSLKSVLYWAGVLDINRVHDYDFLSLETPSAKQARAWESTLALLDRLVTLTRERGYPVVLSVFPMEVQLSDERLEFYHRKFRTALGPEALTGEPQQRLREFGARHDVPVVDLLPAFRAAGSQETFLRNGAITYDPVHPSVAGHRVAADALYDALTHSVLRTAIPKSEGERVAAGVLPGRGDR
jgi:lysophospholipase L1-like esterase